jgi:hypothetical protein
LLDYRRKVAIFTEGFVPMTTISKTITALVVASFAAACFSGAAVASSDMVLTEHESTMLTEAAIGQPYWMLQAQCAGLFGATANFRSEQSQSKGAQKAANKDVGLGTAFLNDAVARIRADRQLDYDTAMATLVPVVQLGRTKARDALATGDTGPKSKWNYQRSFCMDVADGYKSRRG